MQEQTLRTIAEEITDVDIFYEMGADGGDLDPLLGRWAPNLTLHREHGATRLADLMRTGEGVLLDLAGQPGLCDTAVKWADRVETVSTRCSERPTDVDAILVRPDGYVAWAVSSGDGKKGSERSLRTALEKWFGSAR
jgi:hypothetical protein